MQWHAVPSQLQVGRDGHSCVLPDGSHLVVVFGGRNADMLKLGDLHEIPIDVCMRVLNGLIFEDRIDL